MITDGKPNPSRTRQYKSKRKGKKRKGMYTPTLPEQAAERATAALGARPTSRETGMERQARRMRAQGMRMMKKKK